MFGRKNSMKEFEPTREARKPTVESEILTEVRNSSVLPLGSTWHGNLKIDGSITIEGQVKGEVEAKKLVFVAEGAKVDAKVRASLVVIAGEFNGAVHCFDHLEVKSTGRVTASVSTKTLVIGEGAFISGEILVSPDSEPQSKTVTPPVHEKATAMSTEIPFEPVTIPTG
jgi:cytoskeletal protein CcmA (bactofilin family)